MEIRLPLDNEIRATGEFDKGLLLEMYRRMFLIRRFEDTVNTLFLQGLIPGTIHLSHGQEATVVGACLALEPDDSITLTHRGHGQALAKGVTPFSLMAELLGKASGCCGGKGGSLHVGDFTVGALPAIAIVGASTPIAAGMAFSYKRKGTGQIALNFFGDGAANKGDWHEALNLAAIWDLPVVFLCENNLWAVSTHLSDVMKVGSVAERAVAYGIPSVTIDGNDPIAVYEAVGEAAHRARDGGGPSLVECMTYRQGGHKRDDPAEYRPQEEVDAWLEHDPISLFRSRLTSDRSATDRELDDIEATVKSTLAAAVADSRKAPEPELEMAVADVYG